MLWLDPRPPKLHTRLAEAELHTGDLPRAKTELGRAIALDPDDAEAKAVAEAIAGAERPPAPPGADRPDSKTAPASPADPAPVPPTRGAAPAGAAF
jgi:hypothetical protein